MSTDISENFQDKGEKTRFIYKRNPLVDHAFQIFEFMEDKGQYEPIGEYTLIDMEEDLDFTEKKLANLVILMNEKKTLMDLSNLTNKRVLYNIITDNPDSETKKVVFRTLDGSGVSKENAILEIDKGVLKDE